MTALPLFRIAQRTAGRLLVDGVFTLEQAAALIRWSWTQHSTQLLPAEDTGTPLGWENLRAAMANDLWCAACGWYRAEKAGGLCPSCVDDKARAVMA